MDHHCTWLDTCVGAYNYASFLLLLLHLTLGATYAVIVNLSVVLLRRGTVIWPALLALFLLVVLVLASRCIALHVKLIAIGQSTIDHLKDEGGEPAEHDPGGGKRSGGGGMQSSVSCQRGANQKVLQVDFFPQARARERSLFWQRLNQKPTK